MRDYRDKVLVQARDGLWCRAARKSSLTSADSVSTLCERWVTLPWGIERSGVLTTTCPDCRRAEKRIRENLAAQDTKSV